MFEELGYDYFLKRFRFFYYKCQTVFAPVIEWNGMEWNGWSVLDVCAMCNVRLAGLQQDQERNSFESWILSRTVRTPTPMIQSSSIHAFCIKLTTMLHYHHMYQPYDRFLSSKRKMTMLVFIHISFIISMEFCELGF